MADAAATPAPELEEWVLAPDHGMHMVARLREMWQYRRLLSFFMVRAVEMLYRKTQLGWLWVPLRPLAPLLILTVVFGSVIKIQTGGTPYFLFLLVGSLVWNCFDGPWSWGTRGLELNRNLLAKHYFPRMLLPLAYMTPGFAEPTVYLGVLAITLVYYWQTTGVWHLAMHPGLLLAPLLLALMVVFAYGLSLWSAIWQVRARDTRFFVGYLTTFLMLVTPVVYPASMVPEGRRWLLWMNPLTAILESFRWAVLGIGELPLAPLAWSSAAAFVALLSGMWHFHALESVTADRL